MHQASEVSETLESVEILRLTQFTDSSIVNAVDLTGPKFVCSIRIQETAPTQMVFFDLKSSLFSFYQVLENQATRLSPKRRPFHLG